MARLTEVDLNHILTHTEQLWPELRGERIFITGGTGFFGRWLLESFAWANDRLQLKASALVLTRNRQAFERQAPHLAAHKSITLQQGDMTSFGFAPGHCACVIHAATVTEGDTMRYRVPQPPLLVFERNVEGTRRVLEFARRAKARRVLLTSSGAVYGRQPPDMTHIPEDYPGAPDPTDNDYASAYGEGKRVAEFLCTASAQKCGFSALIARCFAFVGPHLPLDANYAIGNFIRDALQGGPIRIGGDGTPYRSYLYAADLAIWLWTILVKGTSGRVYNVGSDADITIAELARRVASVVRPGAEVTIAQPPLPGKTVERYVPSIRRARTELGLDTLISLDDAIRRTAEWHRESVADSRSKP